MIELTHHGVYLLDGKEVTTTTDGMPLPEEARENTITYSILRSHDVRWWQRQQDAYQV
jgi:aconitate hydratase